MVFKHMYFWKYRHIRISNNRVGLISNDMQVHCITPLGINL